jgi:hypothetical protein
MALIQASRRKFVELFHDVNIDWLGKKWYFLAFSLLFSVSGVLSLLFWHHLPLDVDFQGGTQVRVRFEHKPDVESVRAALEKAGLRDSRITTFNAASANSASSNEVIVALPQRDTKEATLDAGRAAIVDALGKNYPSNAAEIRSVEIVGPQVGAALRNQALLATGYSLAGMLVYLWFRFELIYGVAAVVAVFHDTLITIGFFSLFNYDRRLRPYSRKPCHLAARKSGRPGQPQHQPDPEPDRAHLRTDFPDRAVAVFLRRRGAAPVLLRPGRRNPHRHLLFDRGGRPHAGCLATIPRTQGPHRSPSRRQKEPCLNTTHIRDLTSCFGNIKSTFYNFCGIPVPGSKCSLAVSTRFRTERLM